MANDPSSTAPVIAIAAIAGDDVLNAAERAAGALTVSGTASGLGEGASLTLGLAGARYAVTVGGGIWSVSIPASAVAALTDAGSLYRVTVDGVGLSGAAAPQAARLLAVDTTADGGDPVALAVGITAERIVNAPESAVVPFKVSGLDADAQARITFSDGTHRAVADVSANGAYRIDLSAFDGPVTSTVAISDAAGNTATARGNTILVDQKAPVTYDADGPGAPRIALARDTGASAGDRITTDATLTVVPAGGQSTLVTMVDGQVVKAYDPAALSDGFHVVSVTPIDADGRALSAGTLGFTLDRTAPTIALSGVSGAANLVDHDLSGSLGAEDAGATVTIRDGAAVLGTAIADANGAWHLPFVFAGAGSGRDYALGATVTDTAGNTGTSASLALHLDFSVNRALFETTSHDAQGAAGTVYTLYDALLDRTPDRSGWAGWVPAVEHGLSTHDLAARILASDEYTARNGAYGQTSGADFVERLYESALHRHAGSAEIAHWTDTLAAGASRVDVATAIAFSPENRAGIEAAFRAGISLPDAETADAARLYYGLLDRAPDAAGLAQASAALHGGASLEQVARALMGSAEYAVLHPSAPTDAAFVAGLYEDALGRSAGVGETQPWLDALGHGASRAAVAVAISEGVEAHAHLAGLIETGWHLHA